MPMTQTYSWVIYCLMAVLDVLNLEFRLLVFVWDLVSGAWNFLDFVQHNVFCNARYLYAYMT